MILTVLVILLFSSISFIPQPVFAQYGIIISVILGVYSLGIAWSQRHRAPIVHNRDWIVILFVLCLGIGSFAALNTQNALSSYYLMAGLIIAGFLSGRVCVYSAQTFARACLIVCICIWLVSTISVIELIAGKSVIYERLLHNDFYVRYIKIGHRPVSTLFNPVILGSYLVGCMPFSFYLIEKGKSVIRSFGIATMLTSATVIILSASRGVFLGFVAMIVFYAIARKKRMILAVAICFSLLTLAGGSFLNNTSLRQFGLKKIIAGSQDSMLSDYRFERVAMTGKIIRDHPLIGIGINNFRFRFYEYADKPKGELFPYELMIPDNMYLSILAESGLIGMTGFLLFVVYIFGSVFTKVRQCRDQVSFIRLIPLAGFAGLLINMAAYDLFYWCNPLTLFCFLAGLAIAEKAQ
jgi:O-antigen ligase